MDDGTIFVATSCYVMIGYDIHTLRVGLRGDGLAKHDPNHDFAGKPVSMHIPSANELIARFRQRTIGEA